MTQRLNRIEPILERTAERAEAIARQENHR